MKSSWSIRAIISSLDRGYLEVHEVHEFCDFRLQNLHSLLIDLHSVGLLVAFHLGDGPRAASPGVQHDGKLLALLKHLILNTKRGHSSGQLDRHGP